MTQGMFMAGQTLKNSHGKVTLFFMQWKICKFYNVRRQDGGFKINILKKEARDFSSKHRFVSHFLI